MFGSFDTLRHCMCDVNLENETSQQESYKTL
jgi:hypothetical protein